MSTNNLHPRPDQLQAPPQEIKANQVGTIPPPQRLEVVVTAVLPHLVVAQLLPNPLQAVPVAEFKLNLLCNPPFLGTLSIWPILST